jgi:hypothetical protein
MFPNIAFGVALFAASTVVDALRQPVMDGIGGTDIEYDAWLYAGTGYSLIQALVRVFAITYLAIGLSDARRFEDRGAARVEWHRARCRGAREYRRECGSWIPVSARSAVAPCHRDGRPGPDQPAWAYLGWTPCAAGPRARNPAVAGASSAPRASRISPSW